MNISVVSSTQSDTQAACQEVLQALPNTQCDLVIAGFNTEHNAELLQQQLMQQFSCPVMAGSSCLGALAINDEVSTTAGLVLWTLSDSRGHYGVGYCRQGTDAKSAAIKALEMALDQSGRSSESPALLWCILPPGDEEQILQGFAEVVGPNVPVLGGSSADNDVSGKWQQFNQHTAGRDLIQVAVCFPSGSVGISFSSGYQPCGSAVTVTQVEQRQLQQLDHEPAAACYNRLTGGVIQQHLDGGNVLALTTLHPLGRRIPMAEGPDDYLLSHPDAVTEQGALTLFSQVEAGEQLQLMSGSIEGLVNRAQRVLDNACQLLPEDEQPQGALMIYCAGCMLTIGEQVNVMAEQIQRHCGVPVLGLYTFGEQGCFVDGSNRHGNLMISAVVFGQ